jgi:methyl-accepting chemotaxis protein
VLKGLILYINAGISYRYRDIDRTINEMNEAMNLQLDDADEIRSLIEDVQHDVRNIDAEVKKLSAKVDRITAMVMGSNTR